MRYGNERSPQLFRRLIRGVLPALESLTIVCLTFYCMELLAEVAPTLKSLNIKLLARHRLKLYECNLASLRTLTLSMDTRSMMYLYNLEEFPVDELITFLSGLPNLSVLRLKLDHPEAFLHIYSLRNIVELSLGGLDPAAPKCSLDGISQMVNLKTLSITAQELQVPSVFQPAMTVTSLTLHDLATMDIKKLVRVFPSLTVFCVETPRSLMFSEIRQIVVAWPALQELSVRIERLSEEICDCFLKLSKLRKLTLHGFLRKFGFCKEALVIKIIKLNISCSAPQIWPLRKDHHDAIVEATVPERFGLGRVLQLFASCLQPGLSLSALFERITREQCEMWRTWFLA